MSVEGLLAQLPPNCDLARLVRRVSQEQLTWVVVSDSGIIAWERQDPTNWARVSEWLVVHHVALVRV
jgi:hypothetical protein